jgi:hypothetical protein
MTTEVVMRPIALMCAAASLLSANSGIRPRGSAIDYPVHVTQDGVTIAAAVIPPAQVRKLFATDVNGGGYIVVEVAIYPGPGREVTVSTDDFMFGVAAESSSVRPLSALAIAGALDRRNSPRGRTTDVATTVGYESGTDPYTGRRVSGVYTGVGVTNSPQGTLGPPSSGPDPWTMQQELEERALPDGKITQPVAGYLYFPKLKKAKNAAYQIIFYGANPKLTLVVQPAK